MNPVDTIIPLESGQTIYGSEIIFSAPGSIILSTPGTYLISYSFVGDPTITTPQALAVELQIDGSNIPGSYIYSSTDTGGESNIDEPQISNTIVIQTINTNAILTLLNRTPGSGVGHLNQQKPANAAITASLNVVKLG